MQDRMSQIRGAAPRACWRRRAAQALVVLALAQPTLAWPYALDQLLAMPLERLLTLQITHRGPR
jgi:hypothetical protein